MEGNDYPNVGKHTIIHGLYGIGDTPIDHFHDCGRVPSTNSSPLKVGQTHWAKACSCFGSFARRSSVGSWCIWLNSNILLRHPPVCYRSLGHELTHQSFIRLLSFPKLTYQISVQITLNPKYEFRGIRGENSLTNGWWRNPRPAETNFLRPEMSSLVMVVTLWRTCHV